MGLRGSALQGPRLTDFARWKPVVGATAEERSLFRNAAESEVTLVGRTPANEVVARSQLTVETARDA
jgi:hypothetical protein